MIEVPLGLCRRNWRSRPPPTTKLGFTWVSWTDCTGVRPGGTNACDGTPAWPVLLGTPKVPVLG